MENETSGTESPHELHDRMHNRRVSLILENIDEVGDVETHAIDWKHPSPGCSHGEPSGSPGRYSPGAHSPLDSSHECCPPSPLVHEVDDKWGTTERPVITTKRSKSILLKQQPRPTSPQDVPIHSASGLHQEPEAGTAGDSTIERHRSVSCESLSHPVLLALFRGKAVLDCV